MILKLYRFNQPPVEISVENVDKIIPFDNQLIAVEFIDTHNQPNTVVGWKAEIIK